jgi:hypothetical protein
MKGQNFWDAKVKTFGKGQNFWDGSLNVSKVTDWKGNFGVIHSLRSKLLGQRSKLLGWTVAVQQRSKLLGASRSVRGTQRFAIKAERPVPGLLQAKGQNFWDHAIAKQRSKDVQTFLSFG